MSSNDIFLKSDTKPMYTDINNVIKINFTESSQAGGNYSDNLIHISFSDSQVAPIQSGGNEDTSEYFNKIANKIMNKMGSNQAGGFSINTPTSVSDSEIFLSSETINQINVQAGGGRTQLSKNKQSKTFNFSSLKKHLLNMDLVGGSDSESDQKNKNNKKYDSEDNDDDLELFEDSDDDDDIFEDSDDDDEDEFDEDNSEDKITRDMDKIVEESETASSIMPSHSKRPVKKNRYSESESLKLSESESESESASHSESDSKSESSINSSSFLSLNGSNNFQMSESISSPQLMSYRRVNKNNITGRRFI